MRSRKGSYESQEEVPERFIQKITSNEFERQKVDVTEEQKKRLYKNPEYVKMEKKKGQKKEKWNWQTWERTQGKNFNSSDDDDKDGNIHED